MTEPLMPTRQDHEIDDRDVVLDLDAINPKPIVISFRGSKYSLKPISLGEYLSIYQAMERFERDIKSTGENTAKEMNDKTVNSFTDIFSSVCPEITKSVVKTMSTFQANFLLTKVLELVSGKIHEGSKKNESPVPSASVSSISQ